MNLTLFFAFHAIDAYEEKGSGAGQPDIIADVIAYDNHDCIKRFYLDDMMSDSPTAKGFSEGHVDQCHSSIRQFRLPAVPLEPTCKLRKADVVFSKGRQLSMELPAINLLRILRKHRYTYGVTETGKSVFFDGLVKYDVDMHTGIQWSHHGQTAGEPIFVADPQSEEDGGILLCVVLDGLEGKSYLLVLDAKTMKEVGRADVDGVVGHGFHGTHISAERDAAALQL
jgi:torulene dioxygenase